MEVETPLKKEIDKWTRDTLAIITDAVDTKEQKLRAQKCVQILYHLQRDMKWKKWPVTMRFQKVVRRRVQVLIKQSFEHGYLKESYYIMHYFHKLHFKCTCCAYRLNSGACCGRRCKNSLFCSKHHVRRLRLLSVVGEMQVKYKSFPEFKPLLMDYLGFEAVRLKHSEVLRESGITPHTERLSV